MYLSNELFFFESKFLTFELDDFKFLLVLAGQLRELKFPVSEGIGLELVLLVDRHYLLELTLLSSHVR